MKISEKIQEAINRQINAELYSSYLYLAMANHFDYENLDGFAGWMKVQASEEVKHAMKFYEFVNEREGNVSFSDIKAAKTSWKSAADIFKDSYAHEQKITKMIYDLKELADKEKDYAASEMLNWFVKEQVEEEASAKKILDKLESIGSDKAGLYLLDRELAARK